MVRYMNSNLTNSKRFEETPRKVALNQAKKMIDRNIELYKEELLKREQEESNDEICREGNEDNEDLDGQDIQD